MQLLLDEDQTALGGAVRALLTQRAGSPQVRATLEDEVGFDRVLWGSLERDLGVVSLAVPERADGSAAGQVERSVVCEELGRALVPSPYLASAVLATDVLGGLETASADSWLMKLGAGDVVASPAAFLADDLATVTATPDAQDWVLHGTTGPVLWGAQSDAVLLPARTGTSVSWFAVDGSASGLGCETVHGLDPLRRMARFQLNGVKAALLGEEPEGLRERVRAQAVIALGAEQLGAMRAIVTATVDYAKQRFQFGREIGSYQAVKHQLADMFASLEHVEAVVRSAAWTAQHDPSDLGAAADLVTAYVGPAYFAAASDAVRLHGGIGYTWEHDAHLYYKHAKTAELLLSTPAKARQRIVSRLLDAAS